MAKSNRDRIGEVMDTLKAVLAPYVLTAFRQEFKDRALRGIEGMLASDAFSPKIPDEATALTVLDVANCLKIINSRDAWDEVFRKRMGKADRSYVNELTEVRNNWAHQKPFTTDDAYRAADTAYRLLTALGAPREADAMHDIANDLLRLRFQADQEKAKKATGPLTETPTTTTPGLKPWRLVVQPHPDVAAGRYNQAEFAADLAQVVSGKADPEYGDPAEFFRRTYLTEGLVALLANGLRRMSGVDGDPVVQLQTSFGGGKTHSMLALYHLAGGKIRLSQIPGGEKIAALLGDLDDRLLANRAVIVGTAFSATEPRRYKDATTHTLWGEMAYQLGGVEAYRMLENADLNGVSPGSDTLVALFEKYGPVLIIIDELVAFARNLYNASERLPAGSFDGVMTFMQALTEAVRRSSDALLLVSIPESDIEIGGEGGKAALNILAKTIGRIESVWKPVSAMESFEIVRRRLFSSSIDYASRDAVLTEFRKMYAQHSADFPNGVAEQDYFERMRAAYPIHPELFDRLYQDWSTLERFQRTRGVLRLMAAVIHQLWQSNDQSLLIMPGSLPLWASSVRNEMLRYLPENWSAIVDADIDGSESRPFQIDSALPTLGQYAASRRIARSVFVGSAPSVAGQTVRGVEEVRVRLATIQPGEQMAAFGDALRRMSNQLTYLYSDGSRYWYDTRPTVNRIAQDRAQNMPPDYVSVAMVDRLRKEKTNRDYFAGYHVAPSGSADVADEARVRVVVLGPETVYDRNDAKAALETVREYLETRGTAPRLYRNMLVFIVADKTNAIAYERSVREFLAWKSIQDEEEQLNLDSQQRKQVRASLERAQQTMDSRLQETYSWLIVPSQADAPKAEVQLEAVRIASSTGDKFFDRAYRKLRQNEWIVPEYSPDLLASELLDKYLWRDKPHVSVKYVWECLAQYIYMPRFVDENVLIESIREGLGRSDAPFAYATMYTEDEGYRGLVYQQAASKVYIDKEAVLVHPEAAQAQIDILTAPALEEPIVRAAQPTSSATATSRVSAIPQPLAPRRKSRYHGTVTLDAQRLNKQVGDIVDFIVQQLTGQTGTRVTVRLEIEAERSAGFDDATVRNVEQNSYDLKFSDHGFEE